MRAAARGPAVSREGEIVLGGEGDPVIQSHAIGLREAKIAGTIRDIGDGEVEGIHTVRILYGGNEGEVERIFEGSTFDTDGVEEVFLVAIAADGVDVDVEIIHETARLGGEEAILIRRIFADDNLVEGILLNARREGVQTVRGDFEQVWSSKELQGAPESRNMESEAFLRSPGWGAIDFSDEMLIENGAGIAVVDFWPAVAVGEEKGEKQAQGQIFEYSHSGFLMS